jgi:hypothetical protein
MTKSKKKPSKTLPKPKPSRETPNPPAKRDTYYEALGKFVTNFALAEQVLFMLLIHRGKMHYRVGKAVLSGAKTDLIIDHLRRISLAFTGSRELGGNMAGVLEQLKAISTVRNDILHYGGLDGDDYERIISNSMKALTPDQERSTPVSAETLRNMSRDCIKATVHMLIEMMDHVYGPAILKQHGGKLPDQFTRDLECAWQYKTQQPTAQQNSGPVGQKNPEPPK